MYFSHNFFKLNQTFILMSWRQGLLVFLKVNSVNLVKWFCDRLLD